MAGMADALTTQKKRGKLKGKTVNLGKKGSFKIKHPGAFKAYAKSQGYGSTKEAAQAKKDAPGHVGTMARSALGLMAMKKG